MSEFVRRNIGLGQAVFGIKFEYEFKATPSLLDCSICPHFMVRGTSDGVLQYKT